MTIDVPERLPGAGRLFGEALESWTRQQLLFWQIAGGLALLFGLFQYALDAGWLGSSRSSGSIATAFVYAYMLDYLMKRQLFPDWPQRVKVLTKAKSPVARTGMPCVIFCMAYGFAVAIVSIVAVLPFIGKLLGPGQDTDIALLAITLAQVPSMALVAIAIGGFLLYLPAQAAGAGVTLGTAWQIGAPIRGTLIAFALLCVTLAVLSYAAMLLVAILRLPDSPWSGALTRAIGAVIEAMVLFVLSFGLGRLFVLRMRWAPPPLPATT